MVGKTQYEIWYPKEILTNILNACSVAINFFENNHFF